MSSPPASGSSPSGAAPLDAHFLQNLMRRMQVNPPFLNSDPEEKEPLDDAFLRELAAALAAEGPAADDNSDDGEHTRERISTAQARRRRLVAREEAQIEKEIVKIVASGDWDTVLKPNSGQSVTVGEHSVCVGYHVNANGVYRVWEWHGHVMLFDDEDDDGFCAEYIYGNHFERLDNGVLKEDGGKKDKRKEKREEESNGSSGLLGLIVPEKEDGGIGSDKTVQVVRRAITAAVPSVKASASSITRS